MIKAGHTGWNQAEITVQNILLSVNARPEEKPELVQYKPSPPQIKVTLGLVSFSDYSFSRSLKLISSTAPATLRLRAPPFNGRYRNSDRQEGRWTY